MADISQITLPNNDTYSINDASALKTVTTTGSGNAITAISASGTGITATKGNNFLPLSGGTMTGSITVPSNQNINVGNGWKNYISDPTLNASMGDTRLNMKQTGGIINNLRAFSGSEDLLLWCYKKTGWTVTSTYKTLYSEYNEDGYTSGFESLFDDYPNNDFMLYSANLEENPWVLTIQKTTDINATDVVNLWFFQHGDSYYTDFVDWKVELLAREGTTTNYSWYTVLNRNGTNNNTKDPVNFYRIPLFYNDGTHYQSGTTIGSSGYVYFKGIRITVSKASRGGVSPATAYNSKDYTTNATTNTWIPISGMRLYDDRGAGTPASGIAALRTGGGTMYGDIAMASTGIYPEISGTGSVGKSSNKFSTIYANNFYGNITGNVTGNVSGSSASCTGNAATATNATKVNNHTVESDVPSTAVFTDTVTTATTSGSGNAVTAISATNGALTVTKGTTFQEAITSSNKLDYSLLSNTPTIPSAVTESTVSGWGFTKNTGTYSKPSTGIPKTDLASAVQTSLGLADSALQSYTETDPVFVASAAHGISSTDISNWNGKQAAITSSNKLDYSLLSNTPTIPSEVTDSTVSGWGYTKNTGTYSKPSGGIPKTDLASAVQTSLGLADSALQNYIAPNGILIAGSPTLSFSPDDEAVYNSPVPKYLWHDLASFGRALGYPTYYTTTDNSTWTEATGNNELFANKNGASYNIIWATGRTGSRWVWSSGVAWSQISWMILGHTYQDTAANVNIVVECSSDGSSWTTLHSSSNSYRSTPVWYKMNQPSGATYLRLTITKDTSDTTSTAGLSSIKLLTMRWGDQGKGSEYEYPYQWDSDMNIYPVNQDTQTLGNSSYYWDDVYTNKINGNPITATSSSTGLVKPDNSSITIDSDGTLHGLGVTSIPSGGFGYGTTDLTPGVSQLQAGALYLYYEVTTS